MSKFICINLLDVLNDDDLGEDAVKEILSSFVCPHNADVERFIRSSAVPYARQGIAATYIVMTTYEKKRVLIGYYTLASKTLSIHDDAISGGRWRQRIKKYAQYDPQTETYTMSTPLIGQLGKNYANGYDKLITGDELLELAIRKVREIQHSIGGRLVYLECEDNDKLIDFYEQNGFVDFGKRLLDRDETDAMKGEYLIQVVKYLSSKEGFR